MPGSFRRAVVATGAAVVLLGPAAVAAIGAGTAAQAASGDCTTSGTTVTCTYTYTGGNQSFTVPAGVTSLDVTAVGAAGGRATCPPSSGGGAGASVEDTAVPASGGQVLTVIVGGTGGLGAFAGGAPGGSPGGGGAGAAGFCGGAGGGGYSGVLDPLGNALVIGAGGGGGGGAVAQTGAVAGGTGGGGDTGSGGGSGAGGAGTCPGAGGGGGTGSAGGAFGAGGCGGTNGTAGASLAGGPGGTSSVAGGAGGGGGGGYYGGGGGGGGGTGSGGGGGGGGSSFGISGLTNEAPAGPASVTISYTVPVATTTTVSAPASGTAGTAIPAGSISATLSGATSGATGTITFTVFGPQPSPPADCSSGGTTVGTAAVSGPGSYNPSAGFTPGSAGTYWWYASYGGDAKNLGSNSGCGAGMTSTAVASADAPLHITRIAARANEDRQAAAGVTFTDADPNGNVAQYTGTINWGDGTTTAIPHSHFVKVPPRFGGGFAAGNVHTYAKPGTYKVTITINDVGGASATASTTLNVPGG